MERKYSILIVEDDARIRRMLEEGLSSGGYECHVVPDAESAIEKLEKSRVDIMLTDIVMDGMQGLELTKFAKHLYPDMIVIVMTGYIEIYTYDNAINAGATDFVTKPFTLYEMQARIKHVLRQEQLKSMAITDDLTGLLNRRGFLPFADQQIRIADRTKEPVSLLYADLDNLKVVNDRFGHPEGDRLLVETSGILKKTFRTSDILGRLGGDEFAALLLDSPEGSFRRVRERLCDNISERNSAKEFPYQISVSVGITMYDPKCPCSVKELLTESDCRMYEHKKNKKINGVASNC